MLVCPGREVVIPFDPELWEQVRDDIGGPLHFPGFSH